MDKSRLTIFWREVIENIVLLLLGLFLSQAIDKKKVFFKTKLSKKKKENRRKKIHEVENKNNTVSLGNLILQLTGSRVAEPNLCATTLIFNKEDFTLSCRLVSARKSSIFLLSFFLLKIPMTPRQSTVSKHVLRQKKIRSKINDQN